MNNSGDINRYSGIINQQLYHYKLLHNKGSFFNQLVVNFLKYFETLFISLSVLKYVGFQGCNSQNAFQNRKQGRC